MMDDYLTVAKSQPKSKKLKSGKTGTNKIVIEKASKVDIVSQDPDYTGSVIDNTESIPFPSERHTKTTTGGLEWKNSKMALEVKENLLHSSDRASNQVEASPEKTSTPASSGVFSPPIIAPAVVPPHGNYRRSYGGRGRGKNGGKNRMRSKQSDRDRGSKDGHEKSNENQIQSKVKRFSRTGEHSLGGKSSRARRQRGSARGGKPLVFKS